MSLDVLQSNGNGLLCRDKTEVDPGAKVIHAKDHSWLDSLLKDVNGMAAASMVSRPQASLHEMPELLQVELKKAQQLLAEMHSRTVTALQESLHSWQSSAEVEVADLRTQNRMLRELASSHGFSATPAPGDRSHEEIDVKHEPPPEPPSVPAIGNGMHKPQDLLLQRFHENLEVQRQRQATVSARNTLTGFGVANTSPDPVVDAAAQKVGKPPDASPKESASPAPYEVTLAMLPSAVQEDDIPTSESMQALPRYKSKATILSTDDMDMCSVRVNAADDQSDISSPLRSLAKLEKPSRGNRLGKVLSSRSTRTGPVEDPDPFDDDNAPRGSMYPVGEDDSRLKERIQKAILKPNYNTHDQYRSTGVWQAVAKNYYFEQVTLLVIIFNSIWIGVDTDYNDADVILEADLEFQIVEQFFTVFFFFEWTVRWMAFRTWRYAAQDGWFAFDSVLVLFMVLETWLMPLITLAASGGADGGGVGNASILRLLRLLRLSRMARMARLFRMIPELMVMVKGMAIATRSVMVTLTLLTLILYVFGITFTQLLRETEVGQAYFKDVAQSMNTLLGYGIIMEDTPAVINELGAESIAYGALFLVFILMSTFTVLNMLVGVMVETTRIVSMEESERATISYAQQNLLRMLQTSGLDANGDQMISVEEFSGLMSIPDAVRTLHQLGVDVVNLVDQADYIFEKSEELKFQDFMEVVLKLRGTNQATVRDIVDLRKSLHLEVGKVMRKLENAPKGRFNETQTSVAAGKWGGGNGAPVKEASQTSAAQAGNRPALMDRPLPLGTQGSKPLLSSTLDRFGNTTVSLDETWV
mmetsp:Transcript_43626/g.79533  ORF Transcript_43626/g.79533 Transcript_43626/m.79533 type:complete len:813 (-) Transcript_43626:59-2497(-)